MKPFLMSAAAIAIAGSLLAAPAIAQPAGPGPGNPPALGPLQMVLALVTGRAAVGAPA